MITITLEEQDGTKRTFKGGITHARLLETNDIGLLFNVAGLKEAQIFNSFKSCIIEYREDTI